MRRKMRLCMVAVLLLSALLPAAAFGASSSVSMSVDGSADLGQTVTVTVTYKGNALGYANGQLTYDNSKLQYLSGGSSQGDAGLVELKAYASDAAGKLPFRVKFKAVGSGNAGLKLETLETQNLDGDQDMGRPSASKTVKIARTSTTEPVEPTRKSTSDETTVETTQAATAAAPTEGETTQTDGQKMEEEQEPAGGISYPWIIGIAAVTLILIVVVAVALKRKKSQKP